MIKNLILGMASLFVGFLFNGCGVALYPENQSTVEFKVEAGQEQIFSRRLQSTSASDPLDGNDPHKLCWGFHVNGSNYQSSNLFVSKDENINLCGGIPSKEGFVWGPYRFNDLKAGVVLTFDLGLQNMRIDLMAFDANADGSCNAPGVALPVRDAKLLFNDQKPHPIFTGYIAESIVGDNILNLNFSSANEMASYGCGDGEEVDGNNNDISIFPHPDCDNTCSSETKAWTLRTAMGNDGFLKVYCGESQYVNIIWNNTDHIHACSMGSVVVSGIPYGTLHANNQQLIIKGLNQLQAYNGNEFITNVEANKIKYTSMGALDVNTNKISGIWGNYVFAINTNNTPAPWNVYKKTFDSNIQSSSLAVVPTANLENAPGYAQTLWVAQGVALGVGGPNVLKKLALNGANLRFDSYSSSVSTVMGSLNNVNVENDMFVGSHSTSTSTARIKNLHTTTPSIEGVPVLLSKAAFGFDWVGDLSSSIISFKNILDGTLKTFSVPGANSNHHYLITHDKIMNQETMIYAYESSSVVKVNQLKQDGAIVSQLGPQFFPAWTCITSPCLNGIREIRKAGVHEGSPIDSSVGDLLAFGKYYDGGIPKSVAYRSPDSGRTWYRVYLGGNYTQILDAAVMDHWYNATYNYPGFVMIEDIGASATRRLLKQEHHGF